MGGHALKIDSLVALHKSDVYSMFYANKAKPQVETCKLQLGRGGG